MSSPVHRSKGKVTHIAFTDESSHNVGRYRGLGAISLHIKDLNQFEEQIKRLLIESDVQEFKWNKLKDARYRFAALKLIDFALEETRKKTLRVDCLMWDIEDDRHKIVGRDDAANLARMYYHLLGSILKNRWPDDCCWRLCPDENTLMDWKNLEKFLNLASFGHELVQGNTLFRRSATVVFHEYFRIDEILPCKSHQTILIQLADLFVGLGLYSRSHYEYYERLADIKDAQLQLFPEEETKRQIKFSGSDSERLQVLDTLNRYCKTKKLGVSLKTNRRFQSMDPASHLNFWWYEPQNSYDKAPVRFD